MRLLRRSPAAAALCLLVLGGALAHPGFLSPRVALDLVSDGAVLGLATLGATCVLISGGLDLSIGSVMAGASVLLAVLLERAGLAPATAVAITVACGAIAGLAQATLIRALRLPPFIVTLAGMFLFRGIALSVAEESIAIRDPAWIELSGGALHLGTASLRPAAMLLLVLLAALAVASRTTATFRHLHAVGGDERAAFLMGVPVRRTQLVAYALSGAFAALAGVAFALTTGSGSSIAGAGLELEAIAAAVVGGVALGPGRGVFLGRGRGGFGGALLGVLVFGVISNLILFQGTLSAGWTRVAMGGLLFAFLALERLVARTSAQRS